MPFDKNHFPLLRPGCRFVPDEDCHACARCHGTFYFFRRRHHCRYCGHVFCGDCSKVLPTHRLLPCAGPVRQCRDCHKSPVLLLPTQHPITGAVSAEIPARILSFLDREDTGNLLEAYPEVSILYTFPIDAFPFATSVDDVNVTFDAASKTAAFPFAAAPGKVAVFDRRGLSAATAAGSFGFVFFGVDTATSSRVAVKLVPKRRHQHQKNGGIMAAREIAKIELEVRMNKQLADDESIHVARFLRAFQTPAFIGIVSCQGEGGTLKAVGEELAAAARRPAVSPRLAGTLLIDVAKIVLHDVASGLRELHQHNVVHRDVKDGNIVMTADRRCARIIDIGEAAPIPVEIHERTIFDIAGTATTFPPEQYAKIASLRRPRRYLLSRSEAVAGDVFSLGAVMYRLLSSMSNDLYSRPAFDDMSAALRCSRVDAQARMQELSGRFTLADDNTRALLQLVGRMVDSNPATRIDVDAILCHPLLADIDRTRDRVTLHSCAAAWHRDQSAADITAGRSSGPTEQQTYFPNPFITHAQTSSFA